MLYYIHIIFYHTGAFTGKQGLCHNTPNGCHNSWSAYMIQNVNLSLLFSCTCTIHVRGVGNAEPAQANDLTPEFAYIYNCSVFCLQPNCRFVRPPVFSIKHPRKRNKLLYCYSIT